MKIESLNSGLFHVTAPCCYWVFQEYLYDLEEREKEWQEERANEEVKIKEDGQMWLIAPEDSRDQIAYRVMKRKDLPLDHPEYAGVVEVNLDWDKAKELISKAWLETFEKWIEDRYYKEYRITGGEHKAINKYKTKNHGNKIKLTFNRVDSPREYNFSGDVCVFDLSIPKAELNRIIRKVLIGNREGFKEYIGEAYTSYDGFHSWVSNDVKDFDRYWEIFKKGNYEPDPYSRIDRVEHLFWACFDYWLFGMPGDESDMKKRWADNQREFEQNLWDTVSDYDGNGEFSNIMEYKPIEEDTENNEEVCEEDRFKYSPAWLADVNSAGSPDLKE